MRVAIVGSRDFINYDMVLKTMDFVIEQFGEPTMVVSGGARGADTLAEQFADECSIPKDIKEADWDTYKRAAGPMRNTEIVENSDIVVAFWNDDLTVKSGTRDTVLKALDKKMKVVSVNMFTGAFQIYN